MTRLYNRAMTSISDDEPIHKMMVRIPESLRRDLLRWRYANEVPSMNEAVRGLLRKGLEADRKPRRERA